MYYVTTIIILWFDFPVERQRAQTVFHHYVSHLNIASQYRSDAFVHLILGGFAGLQAMATIR